MLTLLLGPDNFSKREYAKNLATADKIAAEVLAQPAELPVGELASQDLFSAKKVFLVIDGLKLLKEENLPQLISSKNQILFLEEKVDKRIKFNKDLLANKNITVKDFPLPHSRELNDWIQNRANTLGAKISTSAIEALAVRLGRDNGKETRFGGKIVDVQEVYNLWQAESEIQKLMAFAAGKEISAEDVHNLTAENQEVDVFDLTNAIADNKKQEAMQLLHLFLKEQTGSDEKGAVIQLNALLSEQFRNVAAVQDFMSRKTEEADILEKTGWKSGRLFIMKKVAARFTPKKVLEFLTKLEALDLELKTSSTPPRVLLDLIIAQLL